MKIVLANTSICISKGGAQRAAINLANELARRGHDTILMCEDFGRPPVYSLNDATRIYFCPKTFRYGMKEGIETVRMFLRDESPDVFISMQAQSKPMLWALACLGTGIPFICSERSDPRFSEAVTWTKPGRHAVLASADYIHELSDIHAETVPDIWRNRVRVIPNAAPVHSYRAKPASENRPSILFLARFVAHKRANLLIEAFSLLAEEFPAWSVKLRGHGWKEKELRQLVNDRNLSDRVSIGRPPDNVLEEYANAHIYCLPSRVEGFPNTALEAMSCGLPVVGISDCHAMRSLGELGGAVLAETPDAASLASTLKGLMLSSRFRVDMGNQALNLCQTIYDETKIYDQWEEFLWEAATKKGKTVMDSFSEEPFASMAILSSAVRKEWLYRHFGEPMPLTCGWLKSKIINFSKNLFRKTGSK